MFRIGLIAAVALAGVAVPATAQRVVERTTTTTVHHDEHMRGPVVRHHRRQVCTVKWVGHRKVRRCFWR